MLLEKNDYLLTIGAGYNKNDMKKELQEINNYTLLDREILALEGITELSFIDLGKSLVNMEKNEWYKKGGFDEFPEYVKERMKYSLQTVRSLQRIYKDFYQILISTSARSEGTPWKVLLIQLGWGKAKVIYNRRRKYIKAIKDGFLNWLEVLFYARLRTKEDMEKELERFQGPELWIRMYCRLYCPDILKEGHSTDDLIFLGVQETSKRLFKKYDIGLFCDMSNNVRSSFDEEKHIEEDIEDIATEVFLQTRYIENKLEYLDNLLLMNPAPRFPVEQLLYYEKLPIYSALGDKKFPAFSLEKASLFGFYGLDKYAAALDMDAEVVRTWLRLDYIHLLEQDVQNGREESDYWFSLLDLIKGNYIKRYLQSGLPLTESAEKADKLVSLAKEMEAFFPLLENAHLWQSIELEKRKDQNESNGSSTKGGEKNQIIERGQTRFMPALKAMAKRLF